MKIKWLVQDVGKTTMLRDNFETLKSINAHFVGFGIIENSPFITNTENIFTDLEESYVIRGGTKIISLIDSCDDLEEICRELNPFQIEHKDIFLRKLKNGIFYNSVLFDQAHYSKLDLPLLNEDAFFLPIRGNEDKFFNKPYFIKPSKDLKTFIPGIIEPNQTIKNFIENSQHLRDYSHELVLLSEVKAINREYRFFIVGENVITGSQYKNGDVVEHHQFVPGSVISIAQFYAKKYQPNDIFTMDLAETPNGVKIVEYNCWNGSGLYHCDKKRLFTIVQNFVDTHIHFM